MHTFVRRATLAALLSLTIFAALADNTPQAVPFNQNWSTASLITVNDNWSGVPGVEGYQGDSLTAVTGADPQTITGVSASPTDLDVIANQLNPNTNATGGVAEFDSVAFQTIALQGSGNADAPYLLINLDTSGQSNINVAYNLRDIDSSTDNAVQPVALQYRVGNAGAFINVPAGFVADATTGPSLATLVTPVSALLPAAANDQPLVQVRVITANAVGSDEWVGIDDITITGNVIDEPLMIISNTSTREGDAGSTAFLFTISLNQPAGAGGVSVDYATANDTATAGSDYTARTDTATIPAGGTSVTVSVDVSGDATIEASESFFVNLSNASGALISDAQGIGTIINDDFVLTPIHAVQGAGATSPLVGNVVNVRGIVTGRKNNGLFVQTPDADADGNPATSQGLFVFVGGMPTVEAAVGSLVVVSGTVVEFVPVQDPLQPPLTELGGSPLITLLSADHPLPTAVTLTTTFPNPAGAHDQLERLEGMRVTAPSFTVAGPTRGTINESDATGISNGFLSVVVTGVARPFREPGIQVPDPDPIGSTATAIPRWDFNPELLAVDSDAIQGTQLNLATGAELTNVVGPLDFGFRRYTILPQAGVPVGVTPGPAPSMARQPTADEFTIASYNLLRFFDTANHGSLEEPVLTATAFANRLNKASLGIRDYLNTPDILGVIEVENLSTLQALATRINSDAVAAGQQDPEYVAYLQEGNDTSGIDVGYLVKTAEVAAGTPRIEVEEVLQVGKDFTWTDPASGAQRRLNDRPPLLLRATVHYVDGRAFPVSAVLVHQRYQGGISSELPEGGTSEGNRVRQKRQAQAAYLANQIQLRQVALPAERIVVFGDFNAYEFNDGLADVMNTVQGTPTADNETAVPGDGADLLDPDLISLGALEDAGEHYSVVPEGNAQSLDHVLVNATLAARVDSLDLDHARINADFPETNRNDVNSASRLAINDPVVAYFQASPLQFANLQTTATATTASVDAGGAFGFEVTVTNDGPDAADFVGVGFALDEEIADLEVTAPAGWSCDAPLAEAGTTIVACNAAVLGDSASATFQLAGTAPVAAADSAIHLAVLADAETTDPDEDDNDASASVNVVAAADLAVGFVPQIRSASTVRYRTVVTNHGPNVATDTSVRIRLDVPVAAATVVIPAGWDCDQAASASMDVTCSLPAGLGSDDTVLFPVDVAVAYSKAHYRLSAVAASAVADPVVANNVAIRRLSMPQL